MVYLEEFRLASAANEEKFFFKMKRTCFDTYYPFQIFPKKDFYSIDFEPITIFYGGNGSGKSTVLNLIANKIGAEHDAVYNRTNFYEEYLDLCEATFSRNVCENKVILTSDGVFDCMLDIRQLNQRIDVKREDTFDEYMKFKNMRVYPDEYTEEEHRKYDAIRSNPLTNLDEYRRINMSMTKSQSQYVRRNLVDNVREKSNGESAFEYFVHRIEADGIYILDEPENSLSPKLQIELVNFLRDSARHYNCQFIIATHSPFILSIADAKIYNLDYYPVSTVESWTDLENVRAYYNLFKAHEKEFEIEKSKRVSVAKQRAITKEGQKRKMLRELLARYNVSEEVKDDIFFLMKSESMIDHYIDYLISVVPSNIDQEELEDRLLIAAEQIV